MENNNTDLIKEIKNLLMENNKNIVMDIMDLLYAFKEDIKGNKEAYDMDSICTECFKDYIDEEIAKVGHASNKIELLSNLWYELMMIDVDESSKDELIRYMHESQSNALVNAFAFTENPINQLLEIKMAVLANIIKFYNTHERSEPRKKEKAFIESEF